ncbi:alpha/beta fold hydrolase [Microbispora amethystogenes]|uniref:2-hydroxy-6-oxo-6-phenylhexa-2,4-dienoate hydrolase n=1 Tax=Microbispora amethystogenes TaxID=1427754 RepID=A0ABQ4F6L0_9ACTN|nr:alpha/beta hydrolase [Microbispora amethystogenes]GIH30467.1 2-hydroxy-6-oxo-6-phenylhexa-2,4-dienoate hydrolase [Microbispora amethystogenes]
MDVKISGVPVHVVERGGGMPVLALHGAGVDHREIAGVLEPVFRGRPAYRRIYPDLPGMGRTPLPDWFRGSDDTLDVVLGLVDALVGDEPFAVVGHSFGAYLARAVADRRPERVAGLALICPIGEEAGDVPAHAVLHGSADAADALSPDEQAQFRDYFVVQTPAMAERFREHVAPALPLVDGDGLERISGHWRLSKAPAETPPYTGPALILAGRQDGTVGYAGPWELVERYPRATFAVLDRAGHALPHEQLGLFTALAAEWLDRVDEHRTT